MHDKDTHRHGKKGLALGFLAGAVTMLAIGGLMMRKGKTRTGMRMESWALKARAEILRRMADAEDMTEREFHTVVDLITSKYGEAQQISKEKVGEISDDLKARWRELKDNARKAKEEAEDMMSE